MKYFSLEYSLCFLWQRSGIYIYSIFYILYSVGGLSLVTNNSSIVSCNFTVRHLYHPPALLLVSHKCAVACVTHLCCLLWHEFCVTWLKISVCMRRKWTAVTQGVEWLLQRCEGHWFKSTCCMLYLISNSTWSGFFGVWMCLIGYFTQWTHQLPPVYNFMWGNKCRPEKVNCCKH